MYLFNQYTTQYIGIKIYLKIKRYQIFEQALKQHILNNNYPSILPSMSNSTLSPNNQQLSSKRHQFYMQIKSRSKQQLFSCIRLKHINLQNNQLLFKIIQQTKYNITNEQLKILIKLAKINNINVNANAIIHIGNLIIDGIISGNQFGNVGDILKIDGNCGYYQWLLLVMMSRKIYDTTLQAYIKMLENINKSKTKDQFRILNTLKCLTQLVKISPMIITQQLFIPYFNIYKIDNLLKQTLSSNIQISKLAYRLANNLFNQQSQQDSLKLMKSYKITQLIYLIRNGLMSKNSTIRSLVCQIFTNNIVCLINYLKNIQQYDILQQLIDLVWVCCNLLLINKQKINVKIQISYLLINYIQYLSLSQLLTNIQRGLIKILKQLSQQYRNQQQSQIYKNCVHICRYLNNLHRNIQIDTAMDQNIINRINYQLISYGLVVQGCQMDQEII